ncbi:MAG: dipeptide/oligopeptide/nickel ABC transporter ATP-binding protein [Chloroflexi bacterium RBG_16_50_9]|nr:MAG: dipeptide/oligopeptide/nickel ABC transporter ATP-binding protein [Chloroflexi bacterium RBG_16_50_9]
MDTTTGKCLLSVENLKTYFYTRAGVVKAVDGVSFTVNEGEALGLAGESACGKSITCLSILRLIPQPAGRIIAGRILFEGEDLLTKKESDMRRWRGKKIAMILQDPLMSLNPVYTIGNQVAEAFRLDNIKRALIKQKAVDVLSNVKIPSAGERLDCYPFQFSGGMRQRTAAAIAIARSPKLLIADEPTTSLDVTIQDQFLRLLKEMQQRNNMGLILVTHDLGIVAESCDRVAIMYAGRIVESGSVRRVYKNPAHPYTQALMMALPKLESRSKRLFQIKGEPPNPASLPPGCSFHPRCPEAMDICSREYPPLFAVDNDGYALCWLLKKGGA